MKNTSACRARIAAVFFCLLMTLGCDTIATREPLGDRIDLNDKASSQAELLDKLYSRVWVSDGDEGLWVLQFVKANNNSYRLIGTGFVDSIDEKGNATGRNFDSPEKSGVVRAWGNRLILHELTQIDATGIQGPAYLVYLLDFQTTPDGGLILHAYTPLSSEITKTRKLPDGTEIKLNIDVQPSDEDARSGKTGAKTYLIRSDEATIAKYLSTTTAEELFKITPNKEGGVEFRAMKANLNYMGRPEFRRRPLPEIVHTQPAEPGDRGNAVPSN